MSSELSQRNGIDAVLSNIDDLIAQINSPESADNALLETEAVKKLLDRADKYGEYASIFALKEAKLLVQIARSGYAGTKRRDMIAWLRKKSDAEIEAMLEECSTGRRLSSIKADETRRANADATADSQIEELKRINRKILAEYQKTGKVNLTRDVFYREWGRKELPDRETVSAFAEKTKNDLLRSGGLGVGDGSGTYVNPSVAKREDIAGVVRARLESLSNDIDSLAKICENSKYAISEAWEMELCEKISRLARIGK